MRDPLAPIDAAAHHHRMDPIKELNGKLLIAMPDMGDPRFAGAVIYICEHSDAGTMGLMINRPMPDIAFDKLLTQMKIDRTADCRQIGVHLGGPVERARGFVLHSRDYHAAGNTMAVTDDIGMTATLNVLEALAHGKGPRDALLALGYAGWGPGQLAQELAENGWLTGPADREILFDTDPAGKWSAALGLIGVSPSMLSGSGGRA